MAYYFRKKEPIHTEVIRIAAEQTDKALTAIENEDNIHEVIHDIRKRCKKLRALLRLIRDDTGKDFYKNRNTYYRDLARRVSGLRDVQTMIESLSALNDKYNHELPDLTFEFAMAALHERKRLLVEKHLLREDVVAGILEELRESKDKISDWPVSQSQDFGVIAPGMKRVYKRGYKAFNKAFEEPKAENFHEFRKRVKYLWYHTRLVKQNWPEVLKPRAGEVHRLATLLGTDHDLAVLEGFISSDEMENAPDPETLIEIIHTGSRKLREKAFGLSQKIFAEKPKQHVKRIGKYWQAFEVEIPETVLA